MLDTHKSLFSSFFLGKLLFFVGCRLVACCRRLLPPSPPLATLTNRPSSSSSSSWWSTEVSPLFDMSSLSMAHFLQVFFTYCMSRYVPRYWPVSAPPSSNPSSSPSSWTAAAAAAAAATGVSSVCSWAKFLVHSGLVSCGKGE